MSTYLFRRVNLKYAQVASDINGSTCMIDAEGADVVSVQAVLAEGTWSAARIRLRRTNSRSAPLIDYDAPLEITPTATMTPLAIVPSQFVGVEVTTGEGSDVFVDLYIHLRKSSVGEALAR